MFEVIGWFGTVLYLINHVYISLNSQYKKHIYYVGNAIAAIALVLSSLVVNSMQAVIINGFWAVVSIALLLKLPVHKFPFSRRAFYTIFVCIVGLILYRYVVESNLDLMLMGWFSAYIFCLGYLLFSGDKLKHSNYLILNFVAATALIPQLWYDHNLPVLTLEIAWAIISLYGVIKKVKNAHLID
jgi:hypothetical protein